MTDEQWQMIEEAIRHGHRHGAIRLPSDFAACREGIESCITRYWIQQDSVDSRRVDPKAYAKRCGEIERKTKDLLELLARGQVLSPVVYSMREQQDSPTYLEDWKRREEEFEAHLHALYWAHREHRERYENRRAPARPKTYYRDDFWKLGALGWWEIMGGTLRLSTAGGKSGGTLARFLHACIEAADPGAYTMKDAAAFIKAEQYRRKTMENEMAE